MDITKKALNQQPLSEVFGFPIDNQSERALRYRNDQLCPFNNIVSNCTKNSIDSPLGVCSMYHRGEPVIICPVRFREDWKIISDAAEFMFDKQATWTHLGEVKLKDKKGKSAGNIDYVLVSYDNKGRIIDFGSLEVQAVYITGNLTGPFRAYIEKPNPSFTWEHAINYPHPDYLSSSRKRLVPQIIAKGSILKQWKKKQAVALQTSFYETLPPMIERDKNDADFAFFLYDILPINGVMTLTLQKIVYTNFSIVLEQIAKFEAGSLDDFVNVLQRKLDAKRSNNSVNSTDIIVNE